MSTSGRRSSSGHAVLVSQRIVVPLAAIGTAAAVVVFLLALRADAQLLAARPEAVRIDLEWIAAAALTVVGALAALVAVVVAHTTTVVRALRSGSAAASANVDTRMLQRLGEIGDAIGAHTSFIQRRNRLYADKTRYQARVIATLTAIAAEPTAVCDGVGRVLYASPGFPTAVDALVESTPGFRHAIATLLDIGHFPPVTIDGQEYFVQAVFGTASQTNSSAERTSIAYIILSQVELNVPSSALTAPAGRKTRRPFDWFSRKRD